VRRRMQVPEAGGVSGAGSCTVNGIFSAALSFLVGEKRVQSLMYCRSCTMCPHMWYPGCPAGVMSGGGWGKQLLPGGTPIPVWEGQQAAWRLQLTNSSLSQAVTTICISVLGAKVGALRLSAATATATPLVRACLPGGRQ
jgi:hypothetical protein